MIRPRVLLTIATLAVAAAGLAGCGDGPANIPAKLGAPPAAAGPSSTTSAATAATAADPETIYVDTTAAHLCSVQARVYTDPGAMAAAYATKPIYSGLTDAQVEQYQRQIITDHDFAGRLTAQIQHTCGSATVTESPAR